MIDSETSAQILQYLQKYEYGTLKHTVFSLLSWDTGFRVELSERSILEITIQRNSSLRWNTVRRLVHRSRTSTEPNVK